MRRTGELWEQVTDLENLYRAAYRTVRGKRARSDAAMFFFELEASLLRLREELRARTYRPGAYRTFWIRDPKRRLISAAPFRDRVVQHALVAVIEPLFERRFVHHSYACRLGKGTHRAMRQFAHWVRTSRYVLKLDVRKFFPSIDHEILKERLRRILKIEPAEEPPAAGAGRHRVPGLRRPSASGSPGSNGGATAAQTRAAPARALCEG